MNTYEAINKLVDYAVDNNLIPDCERIYSRNLILDVMKLDFYKDEKSEETADLETILKVLLDDAVSRKLIGDNVTERDLFDTRLMNCVTPRPGQVISKFYELHEKSPEKATDYFFELSENSDYIRRYRIKKDIRWNVDTPYGEMEMSINMSKPEKDPRAIKAAAKASSDKYPECALCKENEGYSGRIDHPARETIRLIPIKVAGQHWFFQYSPYQYFNEHSIFLNGMHTPMKIDRQVFVKLTDILDILPHYTVGSNAGLPIVGGSILAHEHFQGGRHEFPMAKANIIENFTLPGFDNVNFGIVNWPMNVIRVSCEDKEKVIDACDKILTFWKRYTDKDAFIFAETDGQEHNTVTPISRKRDGRYEIDLVLRNNITTDEYPDGYFHAHPEYHHIKRENIGLIEVMGLSVLPSRLKTEMDILADAIKNGEDYHNIEKIKKHAVWADEILKKYPDLDKNNILPVLYNEIGVVFYKILENCAVFKRTDEGRKQFEKFVNSIK